jgi:hypothetical protein
MSEMTVEQVREMLTRQERPVEDVWKKRPAEDEGSTWLVGEDPHVCCIDLYLIGRVNGAFQLFATYADREDPVRRDDVFETVFDAKAAAEAAYRRLIDTKFWGIILDDECVILNKLERDHRPGCPNAARAASLLGCPESEPPARWLIERGFLVKSGHGYHLTEKAILEHFGDPNTR